MTDNEILEYLQERNFEVNAKDFIFEVSNTSPQIVGQRYNSEQDTLTFYTPDNVFTVKWKLHKIS